MIDFTDAPVTNKAYGGANGGKISIRYQGDRYMLKFPSLAKFNREMSYSNSCVSEYIGCHIFQLIGIPAQSTLLGVYKTGRKEKVVVACKDFTGGEWVLQDFASLKNTIVDTERNGYGTDLDEIIDTINSQSMVDSSELTRWFWDMFIVDALIGNWDRHNGNWGFLYNQGTDEIKLAPIYDCGSSLFPQADEELIRTILSDKNEMLARIYEKPTSAIEENGHRLNYYDFISSGRCMDCNEALKRIVPRIHLNDIFRMIDAIPLLDDIQKEFYKTMVISRKEMILDASLERVKDKKERRDGFPLKSLKKENKNHKKVSL